jgi:hypothetical protein
MQKLLHNRYVLYSIFVIALLDFLYLGYIDDMSSVSTFVLVGLLTSFFSKNMIVILSAAIIITHILKFGGMTDVNVHIQDITEGLTDKEDDEDSTKEDETTEDETQEDETTEPKKTKEPKETKDSVLSTKEEFGQDEKVVYTSVEDQSINEEDKMIAAHEKLLERMNKYKPLLDTLQGISKNIATVKQLSQDAASADKNDE